MTPAVFWVPQLLGIIHFERTHGNFFFLINLKTGGQAAKSWERFFIMVVTFFYIYIMATSFETNSDTLTQILIGLYLREMCVLLHYYMRRKKHFLT